MTALHPIMAFSFAIVASLAWFSAVGAFIANAPLASSAHIVFLVAPITLSGIIQYVTTRQVALSRVRRAMQVGASALLAPQLASALIWLLWVGVLSHGE